MSVIRNFLSNNTATIRTVAQVNWSDPLPADEYLYPKLLLVQILKPVIHRNI